MKKVGDYKHLYEMDTNIAFDWLQVWVDANTQVFKIALLILQTVFVMD